MKKIIGLSFAALFMLGMVSCKKDYTCECTYDFGGVSTTYETEMTDVKKKDAEDACDILNALYGSCELK